MYTTTKAINNRAMVTFVSNFRDLAQLPKLGKRLMNKIPEVIAVHQNVNSASGNVILGQETIKLHGQPDLVSVISLMTRNSGFSAHTTVAAK